MPDTPPPFPPPPKKRSKALWIGLGGGCLGLLVIAAALIALAVPVFNTVRKKTEQAAKPHVITSPDGTLKVTAPGTWRAMDNLNAEADLQLAHTARSVFVVVLRESQEDFADIGLQGHSDLTRESLVGNLTEPTVSEKRDLTIGQHPAVQYEIGGEIDGIKVIYLHTTVDDGAAFHQILAWTLKSQFASKKDELQKVVESFESVPASASPLEAAEPAL